MSSIVYVVSFDLKRRGSDTWEHKEEGAGTTPRGFDDFKDIALIKYGHNDYVMKNFSVTERDWEEFFNDRMGETKMIKPIAAYEIVGKIDSKVINLDFLLGWLVRKGFDKPEYLHRVYHLELVDGVRSFIEVYVAEEFASHLQVVPTDKNEFESFLVDTADEESEYMSTMGLLQMGRDAIKKGDSKDGS